MTPRTPSMRRGSSPTMVVSITSPELRTLNFETVGRTTFFLLPLCSPPPRATRAAATISARTSRWRRWRIGVARILTFSNRARANSIQDQDLAKPRHSGRQPQDIRPSQLHIYLLPRLDHYSIACILDMDIPGVRTKGVFLNERPIAMSSSPTGFRQ